MFLHYAKAYWGYTGSLITWMLADDYQWPNEHWEVEEHRTGSSFSVSTGRFTVWDAVEWYSDGYLTSALPDVSASSRVSVTVQPDGGYACTFSLMWGADKKYYPRLHYHTQCWAS